MIIYRCGKVKLRSHVMLLWACLICILLATIYFVFTLLIYRHYQEMARERIEQGILTLEHRLKQGLKQGLKEGRDDQSQVSQGFFAERITPELLGHIAHKSGCNIYLYADSQILASSLTSGGQALSVKDYPVDDLPVLAQGVSNGRPGRSVMKTILFTVLDFL